jgi:hypothetical protein
MNASVLDICIGSSALRADYPGCLGKSEYAGRSLSLEACRSKDYDHQKAVMLDSGFTANSMT